MSIQIIDIVLAMSCLTAFTVLYLFLYIQYRLRYLGLWTLSWLITTLEPPFAFLLVSKIGQTGNLLIIDQVPSLFSALLLLWGTAVFNNKPFSKMWAAGSLLSGAWLVAGLHYNFNFLVLMVPVSTYIGVLYIRTGLTIFENRKIEGVGRNIAGWSLILWGMHRMDFPFVRTVQWFAPFGYIIALTISLFVAIGLILVFFQRTRKELADSEARYRAIVEDQTELVCRFNQDGVITFINDAAVRHFGKKREEIIGFSFFQYLHPEDREITIARLKSCSRENPLITLENRLPLASGEIRWHQWTNRAIFDDQGNFIEFQCVGRDINERKIMVDALRESEERYRLYIETSPNAITVTDLDGTILMANWQAAKMWGSDHLEELLGKNAFELVVPEERDKLRQNVEELLREGIIRNFELTLLKKDGSRFPGEFSGSVIMDHNGNPKGFTVMTFDITERKRTEEQLKFLSLHDRLTGLYNRTYFEEEMRRMENGRHNPVGIIVCDLDELKQFNDTMGHRAGDFLLVAASGVLKKSFRENDMIARIGGDEFAVLLPKSGARTMEVACSRIRAAIAGYNQNEPEISLSMSIGFSVKNDQSKSMADVFKEADDNMYLEKIFRNNSARSILVQNFRKALKEKEDHAERLQNLTLGLARHICLPENKIEDLKMLAQFHDIGQIAIPEKILSKPGPLTDEEYNVAKKHCEIGHLIAMSPPELNPIADLILKHHEWWNGNGYPLGLKGEDIPLECRILAIVDAYDAMTGERPYRKPLSHEEVVKELDKCAGTQFDPFLVKSFIDYLGSRHCTSKVQQP